MPPRRSASSRNATVKAEPNGKAKPAVVATIDDGDEDVEEMAEIELSSDEEVRALTSSALLS